MKSTPGGSIRRAGPSDLDNLCQMGKEFCAESQIPLTFDPELARETFWARLHQAGYIIFLSEVRDISAGFVMGGIEKDFCIESCAYIMYFYVRKPFRGLGVGRQLAKAFTDEAGKLGAKVVYTSSTGGIEADGIYVNLFKKFGYRVLGRVVMKEF